MSKSSNKANELGAAAVDEWAAGESRTSLEVLHLDSIVRMIELAGFDLQSLDFETTGGLIGDRVSISQNQELAGAAALDMEDDADAIVQAYSKWLAGWARQLH
jgi:hypothetical protein